MSKNKPKKPKERGLDYSSECPARSKLSRTKCRLVKGHDPPHIGPNLVDPDSSVWWTDFE